MVGRDRPAAPARRARSRHVRSEARLPPVHRPRHGGRRQVAAGGGVPRAPSQGAAVCRGRCLSYGEGSATGPSSRSVKELLGDQAGRAARRARRRRRLAAATLALLGEQAAPRRRDRLGGAEAVRGACGGAAARRALRRHPLGRADVSRPRRARRRPQPRTLRSCCSAWPGPSCSTAAPSWGGGKLNATSVLLEPLGADETER